LLAFVRAEEIPVTPSIKVRKPMLAELIRSRAEPPSG
jgi:hypothetical protein